MRDFFDPIVPALVDWTPQGPRSKAYDDGYFGVADGVAEAHCVFIEANHLPQRFAELAPDQVFVIGETGFGTGLNLLLAADVFAQHAPKGARLHMVSVDLNPLTRQDLERAHTQWPQLAHWSSALIEHYPPAAPGHHRLMLADHVELTLMWGDASTRWAGSKAQVDAWFLDGFSPANNPAMWTPALFEALFARSQPGATLASFTASGSVRRGLEDAGFLVEKVSGFGHKRHRIVGKRSGAWMPQHLMLGRACIAGAGLAGATTAHALARRGWRVDVIDPNPPGSGASGNRAGVVYATPSPHLQAQNRFYLTALIRALDWFQSLGFPEHPDDGRLEDVFLHLAHPRRRKNTLEAHDTGAWPSELLTRINDHLACLKGAGFIHPSAWINRLLDHPSITYQAKRLDSDELVVTKTQYNAVVIATAGQALSFDGLERLPMKMIRGQVTEIQATAESLEWRQAHCHAGYLTPAMEGRHCVGATYDLHGEHQGTVETDDQGNIEQLREHLPKHWEALGGEALKVVGQRAAMRCTSPDRLPLVGEVPSLGPNVFLNIAHGSRGITHTPLCADFLSDLITKNNQVGGLGIDEGIAQALNPLRYLEKKTAS